MTNKHNNYNPLCVEAQFVDVLIKHDVSRTFLGMLLIDGAGLKG